MYRIIKEWLQNYLPESEWVNFNATPYVANAIGLNTVSGDRFYKKYVNGDVSRELIFSIEMVAEYDTGTSDTNIQALEECDKFLIWIEKQEFPDIGEDKRIEKIEMLSTIPDIMVNPQTGVAVYSMQMRILYREENENA